MLLTAVAITAFAANSLLCRLALADGATDPVAFTAVRIVAAAATLWLLTSRMPRVLRSGAGDWLSAFWLFLYAIAFSCAYVELEAGTGALLVFGAVQATMILAGLLRGERPPRREWTGFVLAVAGVGYLLLPGVHAPAFLPAMSMVLAGVGWGFYSLRGRGVHEPAAATTGNFVRAVPMVLVAGVVGFADWRCSTRGWIAGLASGALASGLGYVVWYRALAYLTATRAAIVQLAAPVLAAFGGVLFLQEALSLRLGIAALAVFAGVALAALPRRKRAGA